MAIKVTQTVLDTLEEIRESGVTNMFDVRAVQFYADKAGCFETVMWIEDNKQEYTRGIFEGFEAAD